MRPGSIGAAARPYLSHDDQIVRVRMERLLAVIAAGTSRGGAPDEFVAIPAGKLHGSITDAVHLAYKLFTVAHIYVLHSLLCLHEILPSNCPANCSRRQKSMLLSMIQP